ncbi:MAG: MBG domain-containing protein, partial [Chitinophagia bacterium]
NANYDITFIGNNFTITKKPITITADAGQTKVYGAADPGSYTYTLSASLQGGDVLTGSLVRVVGETVGPYAISQGTLTNANYDITFIGNNFTITKKLLTITAVDKTKIYGSANPTLTVTYTGLVNGDMSPTTLPTISTTAVTSSPVGNYQIAATGAVDANYTINYVAGTLTVSKATLIITAENKSKTEGTPNPTLTYTYTGFVNGDLGLAISPTISTTAVTSSPVGSYPIIVTGGSSANYNLIYINGTLSIIAPSNWKFEIPNAFVPNDPYVSNSYLRASFNAAVKNVNYFRVYNRMGKLVYEIINKFPSSIQWDGTVNGVLQEADGYVWIADISVLESGGLQSKYLKGQFLLLK